MKGVDPTAPEATSPAKANAHGAASRKGKEKSVEVDNVQEVDDDAAWLARRTGALSQDMNGVNVVTVSHDILL